MKPSAAEALRSIRRYAVRAVEVVGSRSVEDFRSDAVDLDAVCFALTAIGEASGVLLSDELKATEPAVPWAAIKAMRNYLVHSYWTIDPDIVYDTVRKGLPDLLEAVDRMMLRLARTPAGTDDAPRH